MIDDVVLMPSRTFLTPATWRTWLMTSSLVAESLAVPVSVTMPSTTEIETSAIWAAPLVVSRVATVSASCWLATGLELTRANVVVFAGIAEVRAGS